MELVKLVQTLETFYGSPWFGSHCSNTEFTFILIYGLQVHDYTVECQSVEWSHWSLVAWSDLNSLPPIGSDCCERYVLWRVLKGYLRGQPILNTKQLSSVQITIARKLFQVNYLWYVPFKLHCVCCENLSFYIFLRLQTVGAIVILKVE